MTRPHDYDEGCRCTECCKQKFDRTALGSAAPPPQRRVRHVLFDARCVVDVERSR